MMGCNNAAREKELELRERELELREKELELRDGEGNQNSEGGMFTESSRQQASQSQNHRPTEQELRDDLYQKEIASPVNYLSADYTWRVNLVGNTLIEGKIYNSASISGFKNVKMTVFFKSKTGVILGRETFTVMEFVPANSSVAFRHKIEGWWENAESSSFTIISAEPY